MTTAFLAMVRKDLRIFIRDRRALIIGFVAPIAIASFFGFVFSGGIGRTPVSRIKVLFADEDQSSISRDMFAQFESNNSLDVKAASREQAREAVRKGSAPVAVVIPKGFGDQAGRSMFTSSAKPSIGVLYDPSHAPEHGMVQGILTGTVMQAVSREVFGGAGGQKLLEKQREDIEASPTLSPAVKASLLALLGSVQNVQSTPALSGGRGRGGIAMPAEMHEEAVTARADVKYNGYAHSFGGMGVQFVLFLGIDMGISLLLQKQRGLWKRFRAAPVSRWLVLGSRCVSATVISTAIMLMLFAFARAVYGVRIEGSVAGFLVICLAFSLMTGALGLMVAALGKTPEATRGISVLFTLVMVMLGGAWVPTFIFPEWLQRITIAIPTRWAVDGLDGVVWRGYRFTDSLPAVAVLVGFAILFGAIAVNRFGWDEAG
ncbi:MAG TPA: ABC transporter permease [Bryobacteraceae bacterium]|nr:ABC transporter permease [Bryobacteraceae bacterium]